VRCKSKKKGDLSILLLHKGRKIKIEIYEKAISGFVKDVVGAQDANWLVLTGPLYVLYYGVKGHEIMIKHS